MAKLFAENQIGFFHPRGSAESIPRGWFANAAGSW
jgi:hypothetical protein